MIDEIDGQEITRTTDQIHKMLIVDKLAEMDQDLSKRVTRRILDLAKSNPAPAKETVTDLPDNFSKNKLMEMFTSNKSPTLSETLYANCLFNIATSSITLPQQVEIENFNRNLPQMRKQIETAIIGKYSHVSGKILSDFIQNTPIYLPPTKESYLSSVESSLKSEIKKIRHIRNKGNNNINDAVAIEAITGSGSLTKTKEVESLCNNLNFRPVRDNTVTALGGIALGSDSIKDQKFGLGVLAHEMGHNFRTILTNDSRISSDSRNKHIKVESCISSLHEPFFKKLDTFNIPRSPETRDPRKRTHFVSEDYADLIGSKALSNSNFICEMGPEGMSLGAESADLGPHPSLLFRVLHVEAASGRTMPPDCTEFLELNNYKLQSCF